MNFYAPTPFYAANNAGREGSKQMLRGAVREWDKKRQGGKEMTLTLF